MAYNNFIPTVWAIAIERELERISVFKEICNTKYEGTVKEQGDSVKILGVGKPTITTVTMANRNNDIAAAEEIETISSIMQIDQLRTYNYLVGDIDKAQSSPKGIMDALNLETTEGLAYEYDKYIAQQVGDSAVTKLNASAVKVAAEAASGYELVLDLLDEAIQKLYENNVNPMTQLYCVIPPRFKTLYTRMYRDTDTNNSELMKNGRIGRYGNVIMKMSNNVYTTSAGAEDNIIMCTQRAIACANPLTIAEAYRPEKKFSDAVKGFILFGSKVVRPKEIININVKYA